AFLRISDFIKIGVTDLIRVNQGLEQVGGDGSKKFRTAPTPALETPSPAAAPAALAVPGTAPKPATPAPSAAVELSAKSVDDLSRAIARALRQSQPSDSLIPAQYEDMFAAELKDVFA
ncbi:MAG: hypothetical protein QGD90_13270, partial [Candidatus Hydrogenedentes bacterium]|nr:hypothetical protein [Candidatus Hydrogenedentota bacterium]